MNAITINKNSLIGTEPNSVNSKELHTFLGSKQDFATWIKNRITKYGFIENQDYIKTTRKVGNATAYDYHITLDMAKELCMVENNEKGRKARRYFIECEKNLQIGQEQYDRLAQTVLAQNAQIAQLTIELKAKPKRLPPPVTDETLKQTLIKVHDGYHRILTTCSPLDMIKELSGMTCLFQLIGSTIGDGKNLNTQTKAGHSYWGDISKIQKPKLLK